MVMPSAGRRPDPRVISMSSREGLGSPEDGYAPPRTLVSTETPASLHRCASFLVLEQACASFVLGKQAVRQLLVLGSRRCDFACY
jgi:hypothetical protein